MTLYQKMLVFYAIMGVICAVISWFLTKESRVDPPAGGPVDRRHLAVQLPDGATRLAVLTLRRRTTEKGGSMDKVTV